MQSPAGKIKGEIRVAFSSSQSKRLLALVIGGSSGFFGIGKQDDLIIPWRMIECIGEDTILVRMNTAEYSACLCPRKPPKKRFR